MKVKGVEQHFKNNSKTIELEMGFGEKASFPKLEFICMILKNFL